MSMPGEWSVSSSTLADAGGTSGAHPFEHQDAHSYLLSQMLARRAEYTSARQLHIKVGTWNVAAADGTEKDLEQWLVDLPAADAGSPAVDIYVLGLQEVVDVNQTQSFLKYPDPRVVLNWKSYAQAALPAGFECVASPLLIGILMLVFVSPALRPAVSAVSTSTVGTGLMGYVGNKGGVGVRLVLGDTLRLVFINSHLAAFANATERRNWDAAEILRRMQFEPVDKETIGLDAAPETPAAAEGVDRSDVVIWCGDLNYRVDLPNDDIRRLLAPYMPKELPPTHDNGRGGGSVPSTPTSPTVPASPTVMGMRELPPTPTEIHPDANPTLEGTIESLLRHDQLSKQRREGKVFVGFKEGRIGFVPTYKYDIGTDGVWDSSEKLRAPSWCDRILWRVRSPESSADGYSNDSSGRSRSMSLSTLVGTADEILFETDDPDDEDLVVSRAETPVPVSTPEKRKSLAAYPPDDPTSVLSTGAGDVTLRQLSYRSHQSVSSSDHKPVSALFALAFPAVVPEARAKVHAEVARQVDKLENERRPTVAVVIEPADFDTPPPSAGGARKKSKSDDEILDFGEVRYAEHKRRAVTVANTGASVARLRFVTRPNFGADPSAPSAEKEVVAKPFIAVSFVGDVTTRPGGAELHPGEACQILVDMCVQDVNHVRRLNEGKETPEDVLVLRVEEGRDVFLPIAGEWLQTVYGRSLDELVRIPEGAGGVRGWARMRKEAEQKEVLYSAPREIYRITDVLLKQLREIVAGSRTTTPASSTTPTSTSTPTSSSTTTPTPDTSTSTSTSSTTSSEPSAPPPHWRQHPGWPFTVTLHPSSRLPTLDAPRRQRLELDIWDSLSSDSATFDDSRTLHALMAAGSEAALLRRAEFCEATAGVLLAFLDGLPDAVVPAALWDDVVRAGPDRRAADAVLDALHAAVGPVHANVFVYLMGFVAEAVSILADADRAAPHPARRDTVLDNVVEAVAAVVVRRKPPAGKAAAAAGNVRGGGVGTRVEEERRRAFVRRWVEM